MKRRLAGMALGVVLFGATACGEGEAGSLASEVTGRPGLGQEALPKGNGSCGAGWRRFQLGAGRTPSGKACGFSTPSRGK